MRGSGSAREIADGPRCDLAKQWEEMQQSAAEGQADLAEQLRQAQLMAEVVKEESESQRCEVQKIQGLLDVSARENESLKRHLEDREEWARMELDTAQFRTKLEGLKEVQRQFDREREWYQCERDQDLALITELPYDWRAVRTLHSAL